MARILKRESSKRDLIAQWLWYAENVSIDVADRFLHAADATLAVLARQPEIGLAIMTTKAELQGIRRFPISEGFEKILLFYFPLHDGVELVRGSWKSRSGETFLYLVSSGDEGKLPGRFGYGVQVCRTVRKVPFEDLQRY
jgi:plasmid stabilization system protein ParE